MEQPILHTERLILRPFLVADGGRVRELAGTKEVADTTALIPHPYPEGVAEAWITTHPAAWEKREGVTYAMVLRESQEVVGCIGLSIDAKHSRAELGYWVGPAYWNRGYCTEAGRALLVLGFEHLGLHRIDSRHFARNPSSGRVMIKLGMSPEGVQRESMKKGDRFEDMVLYGLLASDWRAGQNTVERPSKPAEA